MKFLVSSFTLDLSGVPTYTLTLYRELVKRGHVVQIFSPQSGKLAVNMNTYTDISKVDKPDIIIGQHRDCVHVMREAFPDVPMIFSAHGVEPNGEQPPDIEVELYTAINEETFNNLVSKGISPINIAILRDFVDTELFSPTSKISTKLKKVLFISNRKKWKTYAIIIMKTLLIELGW